MNMLDYVNQTPEVLQDILSKRKTIFKPLVEALKEKHFNEIVFIGSGTSYNAAFTAKIFIETILDVKVTTVYPYMFKHYENILNPNAIYIGISQSGSSRLTHEALSKVKAKGLTTISITSNLNSPIAKLTPISLDMSCGVETVVYRTKGYSSTLLDLYLLTLELGLNLEKISDDKYAQLILKLENVINELDEVIEASVNWYKEHKKPLLNRDKMVLIGTGENWGTAIEGSLKLVETVKCFTNAYELEEYMHGPQNALSDESCLFIIASENQSSKKAKLLNEYLKTKVSCSYLVGSEGDLKLPCKGEAEFSALELVIPFQVLSYYLSIDKGIDLDKKRFPDFDEFVGKKL
ncbi:SIS domain-containing protein [Abyssisolibacter fermentans]|uniref:SIS domain-containing protein n=1 Tax=Abyssisolibacter fermentans TaxID=1766203 RepID=UPI00082A3432|nr:SIS domain-containing protein [Abyssisolibacter fermentans]